VNASPAPSGIGRHRPAKQNQSSPAFVNFHFDFGDLVPVNSKKCEAGIRQRPFGKRRPSERKLMIGAPFGRAGGKPQRSCTIADILYVDTPAAAVPDAIGSGKLDFGLNYAPLLIPAVDAGKSLTVLAGAHVGCFELFAKEDIRNVADLKGRSVGVQDWGSTGHVLVALMAAHVGLDPAKDIRWVTDPSGKPGTWAT
jgi:NMT1/THI5 like